MSPLHVDPVSPVLTIPSKGETWSTHTLEPRPPAAPAAGGHDRSRDGPQRPDLDALDYLAVNLGGHLDHARRVVGTDVIRNLPKDAASPARRDRLVRWFNPTDPGPSRWAQRAPDTRPASQGSGRATADALLRYGQRRPRLAGPPNRDAHGLDRRGRRRPDDEAPPPRRPQLSRDGHEVQPSGSAAGTAYTRLWTITSSTTRTTGSARPSAQRPTKSRLEESPPPGPGFYTFSYLWPSRETSRVSAKRQIDAQRREHAWHARSRSRRIEGTAVRGFGQSPRTPASPDAGQLSDDPRGPRGRPPPGHDHPQRGWLRRSSVGLWKSADPTSSPAGPPVPGRSGRPLRLGGRSGRGMNIPQGDGPDQGTGPDRGPPSGSRGPDAPTQPGASGPGPRLPSQLATALAHSDSREDRVLAVAMVARPERRLERLGCRSPAQSAAARHLACRSTRASSWTSLVAPTVSDAMLNR
jgi:hypothetical protein